MIHCGDEKVFAVGVCNGQRGNCCLVSMVRNRARNTFGAFESKRAEGRERGPRTEPKLAKREAADGRLSPKGGGRWRAQTSLALFVLATE